MAKLDKRNKWMTLCANLGVFVGIIFVVIEIQQNTTATEASMREAINAKDINFLSLSIDQTIVAQAMAKTENNEPLSNLENSQLVQVEYINFIIFEHSYYQYQKSVIDLDEWKRHENIAQGNINNWKPAKEMWELRKHTFSPEFVEIIESLIN
ncbi:MAG: hypothetical protein HOJ34_03000 [Kordiimonadaceae bacterium]|nr:hypothetical protein [Kordiimonadaceae bacterium]MBT6037109.1 hypothetical protein [Kordiimonadaceae bacterium]MBT6328728.1 hypothetical protein [Kordiimonadaceae bacterium]